MNAKITVAGKLIAAIPKNRNPAVVPPKEKASTIDVTIAESDKNPKMPAEGIKTSSMARPNPNAKSSTDQINGCMSF